MFIILQLFATKKGGGSTKNGRDSISKRLGTKVYGSQTIQAGGIIVRQRGSKIKPGKNVGMGKDYTLYALADGVVEFKNGKDNRKFAHVVTATEVKPVAKKAEPKKTETKPVAPKAVTKAPAKAEAPKATAKPKTTTAKK